MWNIRVYFLLIVLISNITHAAKILFLSLPMYSHINNGIYIGERLVENGHEVWFTATEDLVKKFRFKEKNFRNVAFKNSSIIQEIVLKAARDPVMIKLTTGVHSLDARTFVDLQVLCLEDEMFLSTIGKQKFDLVILDNTPVAEMLSIIPYKYDIPFILYGTFYDLVTLRVPFSPSTVPFVALPYSQYMNFQQRLENVAIHLFLYIWGPFSVRNAVSLYAPEKPYKTCPEIQRKAELSLIQWDYYINYPVPIMPHVILIGQLNKGQVTQTPEKLKKFMDNASNGVVIVSFGSVAPVQDGPIFSKLVGALLETKYNFIIKGNLTIKSDRLFVSEWIPQSSLLTHKNVKLFISHCGMNGLNEALSNHVPILGFPLFAEQEGNAFKMQDKGFGISMNIALDSREDITKNINEVITNPKYKDIKRVVERFKDMEKDSLSEAVYWIEHVLKYGGDHLKSSSLNMPLYQLLLLDILLFMIVIVSIIAVIIILCGRTLIRKVTHKAKKE